MEITRQGLEKLGFRLVDHNSETSQDYTFEKLSKKTKHHFFLIWQPATRDITVSRCDKQYLGNTFKIERIYHGNPSNIEEIKEALKVMEN